MIIQHNTKYTVNIMFLSLFFIWRIMKSQYIDVNKQKAKEMLGYISACIYIYIYIPLTCAYTGLPIFVLY